MEAKVVKCAKNKPWVPRNPPWSLGHKRIIAQNRKVYATNIKSTTDTIRQRSDYIMGFVTPAIGPDKSKKLTWLIAPVHNTHGKVWMNHKMMAYTDNKLLSVKPCMVFFIQTLPRISCTDAISHVSFLDLFGPIAGVTNPIM